MPALVVTLTTWFVSPENGSIPLSPMLANVSFKAGALALTGFVMLAAYALPANGTANPAPINETAHNTRTAIARIAAPPVRMSRRENITRCSRVLQSAERSESEIQRFRASRR